MPGGPLIGNGGSRFTVLFNECYCLYLLFLCFVIFIKSVLKLHKITKNVLMALFLLTGLVQT